MNLFSSFGIATRLYAVAGLISLALAGVAVYAYVNLHELTSLIDRAEATRVPQLQRMAATELNITRSSLQLRHAMLARNPQEMSAALADIGERRKAIEQVLSDYEKALFTQEGRDRYARVPLLMARFWEVAGGNVKLVQDGQKAEAFAYLVDKTIPARNELLGVLGEMVKVQETALRSELTEARVDARKTLQMLLALVVATVVALLGFSAYLAMALRRRVATSREVAERVRDGDLTTPVRNEGRDEFTPLLAALSDMQASLTQVVGDVRRNSESVATASAQIAQGNQDLSQRTESQASALQQTAATMEELGSTVRNNADNARQASQLAVGASSVAAKGGQVVGEVVATMRGINDSSKKIADIIAVIDGIAFQTNILALNAAVEAARAGEQGRGFAVVAGEVRSLAQRSAEAAKEIKSLITHSVEQVEQGTSLVTQAGSTMEEIVNAIQRVTDIVAEISAASVEQSEGVGQVGQAVTKMDEATQRNAALVEESAAAAASLRQQAEQLVSAVAVFRLSGTAAATEREPALHG